MNKFVVGTVGFAVVFVGLTLLVYTGKVSVEILSAPIAGYMGWLMKGPGES